MVATPLLAYTLRIAFVDYADRRTIRGELDLLDDVGFLLTAAMGLVFGAVSMTGLSAGVPLGLVVFCPLALTLVRLLAVVFSLLGSRFAWPERVMLGWLGPRGTTSIVFGLVAFDVLADEAEMMVLPTMVMNVLGSILIHGIGAPGAAHAFNRARANRIIG